MSATSQTQAMRTRVRAVRTAQVGREARYDRARDLPRLLALWPAELVDTSRAARSRVVARLRAALRAERRRGVGGHWTYDLMRHAQLIAAYRYEVSELDAMGAGAQVKVPRCEVELVT
jgi:hypothetical protein